MLDKATLTRVKRLEMALVAALDVGDAETAEAIHAEIAELFAPASEEGDE